MTNLAINVEHLSKRYYLGEGERGLFNYKCLRDRVDDILHAPFRWIQNLKTPTVDKNNSHLIWALRDVSFEIKRGEIVGIIGRNGSGKSTLLKILSRITVPTEGHAKIHGRVGSLLEVGTGFHPELSGRENIYLNAAILGMKKRETKSKFDDIVAFAEIEKFMDTPVKHYSSGMYVRLAFAVAAHLDTEILFVDEVLAVGDVQFQKKCLGKMNEVARQGRTVLFVSHNMPAILGLCQRALLLDGGKVRMDGEVKNTVEAYLGIGFNEKAEITWPLDEAPGNHIVKLQAVRVRDTHEVIAGEHALSKPIILEMEFSCLKSGIRLNPSFHVQNSLGICVFATSNVDDAQWGKAIYQPGSYLCRCVIPGGLLNEGVYRVSAIVVKDLTLSMVNQSDLVSFQVHDDGYGRGDYTSDWIGVIRPQLEWAVECRGDLP